MDSGSKPKVIVVGCGISGCMTALAAGEAGAEVSLFSNSFPERSAKASLRDGFNVSSNSSGECDGAELHSSDTLAAGCGLADKGAVSSMCRNAPALLRLLGRMGVHFDKTAEGNVKRYRSFASTKKRTAYAGQRTAQRILSVLHGQLRRARLQHFVSINFGWEFLSVVKDEKGVARGIVAVNTKSMDIKAFAADAVALCTGGYPSIFSRSSLGLSSDGSAMASCFVQGAALANAEFVEFRPYAVFSSGKMIVLDERTISRARPFVMRSGRPDYFVEDAKGGQANAASYSHILREFHKVCHEEKSSGTNLPCDLMLDISCVDPDVREELFFGVPGIMDDLGEGDVQIGGIRVIPSVHATLGGLLVDDGHMTSIEGLFAAGSSASRYHGAGILPGNAILSSLHGGLVAGRSSYEYAAGLEGAKNAVSEPLLEDAKRREEDRNSRFASHEGDENARVILRELQETLYSCAGFTRRTSDLKRAEGEIAKLKERSLHAKVPDRSEWANAELVFARRLSMKLELASAIVASALARDESRGVHFKPEFPDVDDKKYLATTVGSWNEAGQKIEFVKM